MVDGENPDGKNPQSLSYDLFMNPTAPTFTPTNPKKRKLADLNLQDPGKFCCFLTHICSRRGRHRHAAWLHAVKA